MPRYRLEVEVGTTMTVIVNARSEADAREEAEFMPSLSRFDTFNIISIQQLGIDRPEPAKHTRFKPYQ